MPVTSKGSHTTSSVSTGLNPLSSIGPKRAIRVLVAGARELAHERGDQDLATVGRRAQPRGLDRGLAEVVALVECDLARS